MNINFYMNTNTFFKINFWLKYFSCIFFRHKKGFGVLEILLSSSIFILLLVSVTGLLLYGRDSLSKDNLSSRASLLANEGMMAVESIRNKDFAELSDGVHGLTFSGGEWIFSGQYDETVGFKRVVTISTISEKEKKAVVEIAWTKKFNRLGRVILSKHFTDWAKVSNEIIEAQQLNVNISSSTVVNNEITQTFISNLGPQEVITIKQIRLDWAGAYSDRNIISVIIDGNNVWSGSTSSGEILDINSLSGFELEYIHGDYPIGFIFDNNVVGIEVVVRFIMTDDSEKQIVFDFSGMIDTEPPGSINDLSVLNTDYYSIELGWTAPGDDGYTGIASSYQIKYANFYIDESNWDSASIFSTSYLPGSPGFYENIVISGLNEGTTYYFAIKTLDEVGNISPISNIATATTNSPPQSNYLSVNFSSAYVGSGSTFNRYVYNIFLANNGSNNINLSSIRLSWGGSPASSFREMFINGALLWSGNYSSGSATPASIIPVYTLIPGGGPYNLSLRFQHNFSGRTINYIDFIFSDGSIKTVGPINL